ncbi:MAG: 3-oxoacyl-ACP synthase [Fulvivirga sp.]
MKNDLLNLCRSIVTDKVAALKAELKTLQESADQDTKSSVGDKYETGRAMVHLAQENVVRQYEEYEKLARVLNNLKGSVVTETIEAGSLIITNLGTFFMSVGLGKVTMNEQDFFAIAPNSPIGAALLGKKKGDSIELNGRNYIIQGVK